VRPLPQALFESLFEICDLYTTSLNEKEYISFARALLRASTVKRDGQLSFRHRWPAGAADGAFLSRGIVAMQQYIEKAVVVSAATGAANYGSTKNLPTRGSSTRSLPKVDVTSSGGSPQWDRPATAQERGLTAPSRAPSVRNTLLRSMSIFTPAQRSEATKREAAGSLARAKASAAVSLFRRWATSIQRAGRTDVRLLKASYVGNRHHGEDDLAVGIADLASLLASLGVCIDRDEHGLPQLVAFYQLLDVDGDGFITQDDFCVALLEAVVDPERPERGPSLPSGGSRRATASRGVAVQRAEPTRGGAAATGRNLREEAIYKSAVAQRQA
jgi:hypothetical protein